MHSDVLIIGAGSAGSVIAECISRDAACNVSVVEAGPSPSDPRVAAQITDAVRMPIGEASSVVRHYVTSLTGEPHRTGHIMRGAVVGGSGAVNGGYFCRALPEDFAEWAIPGWSWDDVLPHFLAIETDTDFFDNPLHGSDGPILVRRVSEFDGCTASFVDSATEIGYRWIPDLNGATPEQPLLAGVGAVPLNIDSGVRVGPGGAYLQPALSRSNLRLLPDTRVHRIRIENGRAVGAECSGPGGAELLTADRIVLSAGAIGSAHLLLLSGVGPVAELTTAGIAVAVDLPVGMRTSDHPEWVVPVDWTPTHDLPPVEALLVTPNGLEIRPYTRGFGSMVNGGAGDPADRPHIGVALMHPRSRGTLRVVSADADVPPVIEHRYDSDPHDVATLSAGAELARELASSTTEVGGASWSTAQHLCGTAPMGSNGDASAVVDERCRVRGVEGLWVVDGSILPTVTGRGPHATIVMLGHRAAEFVVG